MRKTSNSLDPIFTLDERNTTEAETPKLGKDRFAKLEQAIAALTERLDAQSELEKSVAALTERVNAQTERYATLQNQVREYQESTVKAIKELTSLSAQWSWLVYIHGGQARVHEVIADKKARGHSPF